MKELLRPAGLAEVAVQDAVVHLEGRLPLRLLRLLSLLLRLRFRPTKGSSKYGVKSKDSARTKLRHHCNAF